MASRFSMSDMRPYIFLEFMVSRNRFAHTIILSQEAYVMTCVKDYAT